MEAQPQQQLSSMPKFEERVRRWKFPEAIQFDNRGMQESYQRQMFIDVITLKKPERVPVCPAMGIFRLSRPNLEWRLEFITPKG